MVNHFDIIDLINCATQGQYRENNKKCDQRQSWLPSIWAKSGTNFEKFMAAFDSVFTALSVQTGLYS